MRGNIITARFDGATICRTERVWQWDRGQVLRFDDIDLPAAYTVHIANVPLAGDAATQIGDDNGVEIPDAYLQTGDYVYAWIYLHAGEDDGETEFMVTIPVAKRPRPTEETPTPEQRGLIEQAITALDAAVRQTGEDVEAAARSAAAADVSATAGAASAVLAESWAVGGTDTRQGEDTDNAAYYAGQAEAAELRAASDAEAAARSAESSDLKASAAAASAVLAESWAVGGTDTRQGEDTNNAEYFAGYSAGSAATARHWAELAEQSAERSGYVFFDIDDATGEMIVTVSETLEAVAFEINENTGELEVIVT